MESVSNLTRNRWFLPALAAIGGLVVGVLYAWVLNPVQWVDGEPHQLRADLREDYLRMVIDSYSVNLDADLAVERYERLEEFGPETLAAVAEQPDEISATAIQGFRALLEIESEVEATPTAVVGQEPDEEPEAPAGPLASVSRLIVPVCGGTLALGLILAAVLFIRNRSQEPVDDPEMIENLERTAGTGEFGYQASEPEMSPPPAAAAPVAPEMAAVGDDSLATFRTIYTIGDDDYDDSFSIESPTGDFLGECGVGIGDLIGVGEPNKVAAFEVWLFDKNDIQTVTKVLMSRYAYQDEETRSRLAAKGDPAVAEPGGVVTLQTASLEVEARIVDLSYGESALPSESFFERLTIELRAWSRDGMPS